MEKLSSSGFGHWSTTPSMSLPARAVCCSDWFGVPYLSTANLRNA